MRKFRGTEIQHEKFRMRGYSDKKRLDEKLKTQNFINVEQYQYIKSCIYRAAFEAIGDHKTNRWDQEIEKDIKKQKRCIKRIKTQEHQKTR